MSTPVSTYCPVVRSKYHTEPSVASPSVRNPRKYTRFWFATYWPSNRVAANGLGLANCHVIWVPPAPAAGLIKPTITAAESSDPRIARTLIRTSLRSDLDYGRRDSRPHRPGGQTL